MAVVRVMPEDVDVDLERLKEDIRRSLPAEVSLERAVTEDVAFGIKALKLYLLLPEEEGGTSKVEEAIAGVRGVGQVDVELVTRV